MEQYSGTFQAMIQHSSEECEYALLKTAAIEHTLSLLPLDFMNKTQVKVDVFNPKRIVVQHENYFVNQTYSDSGNILLPFCYVKQTDFENLKWF